MTVESHFRKLLLMKHVAFVILMFTRVSSTRVSSEWYRLCDWKLWAEKEALQTPIGLGSTLSINVNGFLHRHLLYRSPFP